MITNTHSVGVVRDAVVTWIRDKRMRDSQKGGIYWSLPVVAETFDGVLNDINGFHVKPQHVFDALENASGGAVVEGNVGGGTGMVCHRFKGGIGTASRLLSEEQGEYTIGALVQANYGSRENLTITGVPVGREISDLLPEIHSVDPGFRTGSIIVMIATDAPIMPHQLKRLARRVPLGIARVGGFGGNFSGDIFIAFSTANPEAAKGAGVVDLTMLSNDRMTPLFEATAQATEEAIINALVAAETMVGINGNTVYSLPHDRLREVLKDYKRLNQ
jgi:D-aminopeptidase